MTYTPEPYTISYYHAINEEETEQAKALSEGVKKLYNPKSIVDLGCGTGLYLYPYMHIDRLGIDISIEGKNIDVCMIPESMFVVDDITKKDFLLPKKYDVAYCLEVLEHIGMEHMEQTIKNITSASDTIITSFAQVGQAGLNHITLQPYSYWEKLFNTNGFERAYYDEFPLLIPISKVNHTIWIIRNLMVFKRAI